jgi:hypothetical protein
MSDIAATLEKAVKAAETGEKTLEDVQKFWTKEINAATKMVEKWRKTGDNIVNRYEGLPSAFTDDRLDTQRTTLNMFHSNTATLEAMLYGNTPKIEVSRRYADPNDDVGRVAAEMMERLLNLDISAHPETIDGVFKSVLQDRLLPGLGCARVRYEVDIAKTTTPEGVEVEQLNSEDAVIDYWFWGDVLWSWARSWAEVRWVAFRNYLTKEEVEARFPDFDTDTLSFVPQVAAASDDNSTGAEDEGSVCEKTEIWEIWNKDKREVVWYSNGASEVLEVKPDPLKLSEFFPCPPFMLANPTTRKLMPTPDFKLAEDLYNEIDVLTHRIQMLTSAVKAVGVYDASAGDGLKRVFQEGTDNTLIPVDTWAVFAEKGGMQGTVDWLPIQDIVNAMDKLRDLRNEQIQLLQQVTGMADVMRGDLSNQYEGVGQSQMKAKFAAFRVQALQEQFATFASALMQIKAEVISRHFSPETIFKRANIQHTLDVETAAQAIELIKQPEDLALRVVIRPESVAMTDFAALRDERVGFLNALSTFMQSAAPLLESDPTTKPFLLQLLQWTLSGFKGSQEIEGVIDRAIHASMEAEQQRAGQPPEPTEAQLRMQELQMQGQMEMAKEQAKSQAAMQQREHDMQADIQTTQHEHQLKMQEMFAAMQTSLAQIEAKMRADIATEQVESEANIRQVQAASASEVNKDAATAQIEAVVKQGEAATEIDKIAAQAKANMAVEQFKQMQLKLNQTED